MANRKISEQDKAALLDIVQEEIKNHMNGEPVHLSTNSNLADLVGVSYSALQIYLRDLPPEIIDYRRSAMQSQTIKKLFSDPTFAAAYSERTKRLHKDPTFAAAQSKMMKRLLENPEYAAAHSERMKRLHKDPTFAAAHSERNKRRHESPEYAAAQSKMMKRLLENPEYAAAHSERMKRLHKDPTFAAAQSKMMKRLHKDPTFAALIKSTAIQTIEKLRKNSYFIENRFYSSSKEEGAVALLLERYVKGYRVQDKVNFQVNNNGLESKTSGIDFLVGNAFLEWHPIIRYSAKNRRGDIPQDESDNYHSKVSALKGDAKKQFQISYMQALADRYRENRQRIVDNSEYKGTPVVVATDVAQLYQFLSQQGGTLPIFSDFKAEFNKTLKYVKQFKVEKTPEQSTIPQNSYAPVSQGLMGILP